jgi:hypothetical protein
VVTTDDDATFGKVCFDDFGGLDRFCHIRGEQRGYADQKRPRFPGELPDITTTSTIQTKKPSLIKTAAIQANPYGTVRFAVR